jgi:hypothetical protein
MRLVRRRPKFIEQQIELQLRDREGRGQDLKAYGALVESTGQLQSESAFVAGTLQFGCNASGDFEKVRTRATSGIENNYLRIGEPPRPAKFCFQKVVNTLDLIADNFGWRVPHA